VIDGDKNEQNLELIQVYALQKSQLTIIQISKYKRITTAKVVDNNHHSLVFEI
jgi:hypothetical protein